MIIHGPSPRPFPPPSAAGNLLQLIIPQTEPLWNRESHSAWSVAHGVTTFFFPEMELTVEALNGHKGVLYGGLHGNPELVLLFSQFQRHIIQPLRKFIQDFQGNMAVGGRDLGLGEHPIWGNKSKEAERRE